MSTRGAAAILAQSVVLALAGALTAPPAALAQPDDLDEASSDDDPDDDDGDGDGEPRLITAADRAPVPAEPDAAALVFKDHHRQFAVGLQFPLGLRVIKPYDEDYCGQTDENEGTGNAKACIGRVPASLEFVFAYGIGQNLELLLEVRLGLERDFGPTVATTDDGPRMFRWSPGVKFYFSDAGTSKLFSSMQLAFDHTSYQEPGQGGRPTDFVLRNVNGLQLDLHPSYGVYVFVAEELAFRRWIWAAGEFGIGIQGRYP